MFEQIVYAGANSLRGLSYGLWKDCPDRVRFDPNTGFFRMEDFDRVPPMLAAGAEAAWGNYRVFGDVGGALVQGADIGGTVVLGSDGNDEGTIVGQSAFPMQAGIGFGNLWIEFRLKTSTIADTKHNILFGLYGKTAITTTASVISAIAPVTATGAIADVNIVGFRRTEAAAGGALLDTVYKADGVTAVTVKAGAAALVADTYIKCGMKVKQRSGSAARLEYFVNGVPLADYKDIPAAAGTDFPNDVVLGWVCGVLNATATTPGTTTLDWVAYGYQFQADVSA